MAKSSSKPHSLAAELKLAASQLTLGSAAPMAGLNLTSSVDASEAASSAETLNVDSSSFSEGEHIPDEFSAYGEDRSPALRWRGIPDATVSVAVLAEDPDAHGDEPVVHWIVYNLPPTVDGLPEGVPAGKRLEDFGEAAQGRSHTGDLGYAGPRPPKNDPAHHYHFEVFALDRILDLEPGAGRPEVLRAMHGHVIACGDLVGLYQAPSS
jgi:Raf kinase inhibitor-like YbhB/YbcL family protein